MAGVVSFGECCVIDGATALELVHAIRLAASAARANGSHLSPRLAAAAREFAATGERWATAEREAFRTRNVGIPAGGDHAMVDAMQTIGSREAARMLGISPRAVVARANRGTLPGHQLDSGAWLFKLTDVADVRARKDDDAA